MTNISIVTIVACSIAIKLRAFTSTTRLKNQSIIIFIIIIICNYLPRIASSVPKGTAINEGPAKVVPVYLTLPFELRIPCNHSYHSTRQPP